MNSLTKIEASDNPNDIVRLLISPTTDRATAEALLASNESYDTAKIQCCKIDSEKKGRQTVQKDTVKTLEYMSQTQNDYLAVKKLIELVHKKKIQVKVYTKDKLHAKAYIFELDNRHLPIMAIVGSSNLSISGIKNHTELNLRTNHDGDSKKLLEWFDNHWNDPSCQEFTEEIADILERSWAGTNYSPSDVYDKAILHEHEDKFDDSIYEELKAKELFDFQKTAVADSLKKLEDYGGVMIADVVGTGKSFIGSAILKHLKENNRSKPLIICPPHLIDMWKKYMQDFDIYGEVVSRYKIGTDDNILSRYTHCDVVLVDESHNFRNSNTNAYKALLAFMEEKADDVKIIMLSATPISNSIRDLKNQLRLFPSEKLSHIPPLNNVTLDEYFKGQEDKTGVSTEGAIKIQELLKYILIRRTRTQIMEKYATKDDKRYYLEKDGERKYFPMRKLQNPEEYDVDKVYNNSFDMIQQAIEDLRLARYAPSNYIKEEYLSELHPEFKKYSDLKNTTNTLVGLMRTSLLKRMESSIAAFASSVGNIQEGYKEFRNQLDKGRVPIGKDFHDEIYKKIAYDYDDYDNDDFEKNMASIKSQYNIDAFDVVLWKKDLASDINLLSSIKGNLVERSQYTRYDDKLHTLRDTVKGLGSEKILIFSESAVTAKYIYTYLKEKIPELKMAQIDSKQGTKEKNELIKRFDPKNNNADISKERELDMLISTDVLSEGVNLQAGKVVINYDFHWNPVRLIQRVGRVDRIGTEHEIIDIINFLSTSKIDATLSLKDRVAAKIDTIKRIIGHDQQILESSEEFDSNAISAIYNNDIAVLNSDSGGILDIAESKSEKDADKIKKDENKLQRIQKLPFGIRSVSGKGKLVIACEALETIVSHKEEVITSQVFRRHYEITADGSKHIWSSSFLRQIGNNIKNNSESMNSDYNKYVAKAWTTFNQDMKNTIAQKTMLKHQKYFEKKLIHINTYNSDLKTHAMRLLPFIRQRMYRNYQPYRKLNDLHKEIDQNVDINDNIIIEKLELIFGKYANVSYTKRISKPRILYSMMMDL